MRPFYFDREEDNRIRLEIHFDYGDKQVSSQQELEELPFSSDVDLEERASSLSIAGFEAISNLLVSALKPAHSFSFHEIIPAFEKLECRPIRQEELYSFSESSSADRFIRGPWKFSFDLSR